MDNKAKKVVDRFMEEYKMDHEGDVGIETAKFILDQIVTSNEAFKQIVLERAEEETGDKELAEMTFRILQDEVWPRIAKDLPRLV
jgi:hypothetical protein